MAIMALCIILGLGALLSPSVGPYCVRMVGFLARALQTRSPRRRPAEDSASAYDTAYRDSKDARIHSLERRNEELEGALAETKREVEQRNELIEELWFRMNGVERKPAASARTSPHDQLGQAALGAGLCCLLAAGFVGVGLAMIPTPPDRPAMGVRRSPLPTMIDLPMLTSGGEVPLFERYVIVVEIWRDEPWPVLCREYELLVLDSFYTLEWVYESEDSYLVWHLVLYASDAPPPYLRL